MSNYNKKLQVLAFDSNMSSDNAELPIKKSKKKSFLDNISEKPS